jgi:hypothetical protein
MLNYDELIFLDAEELGEGSIAATYHSEIAPALQRYGVTPASVAEEFDADHTSYRVVSQGKTYVVYSPEIDISAGQNWVNATFALFDIVNRQLENTPYRFYAINGGNDLGGMFLTEEACDDAIISLPRKSDWPYLPTPDAPWYGQPYNE